MSWLEPRLVKNARQKKKKKAKSFCILYSVQMLVQMLLLVFRDAAPRGRNEERKKKKLWNQTTQLLQQTPPPRGTRHHRFSKHARTAVSHEPKLERQPELRPGPLHDTHASGRKMPQPVARLSQEQSAHHHLDQNYLRRHFFRFLSRTGCKSATRRNHTKQHATAPAANCLHEEPEIARIANALSDPQTARSAFSISCLEQPGFAAQAVPLKWSFN